MKNFNLGLTDLLGVVFITLKLLGVIDWSWWWVLSPFIFKLIAIVIGCTVAEVRKANKKGNRK